MILLKAARPRMRSLVLGVLVTLACSLTGTLSNAQGVDLINAAEKGDLPRVKALIATKVDVNAKRANGSTALIRASMNGHLEVVRVLLAAKADVNAKTVEGITALDAARERKHLNVSALLVQAGAVSTKAGPIRASESTRQAIATTAIDLTGSWIFLLTSTHPDKHQVQFDTTIKQEGNKITGDLFGDQFAATITGSEVVFQTQPAVLGNPNGDVIMKGKIVSPNKITGELIVPTGFTAAWTWEFDRQ